MKRSLVVLVGMAALLSVGAVQAMPAERLRVEVRAAGVLEQVELEVAVVNEGPELAGLTVRLDLEPDVNVDPERYYRVVAPAEGPALSFGVDPEPRLVWRDPAPLAAGAVRSYRATLVIANVHPHRYRATARVRSAEAEATSAELVHERSLGALFADSVRRLERRGAEASWGPYRLLRLRNGVLGLSGQPGWPGVLLAVDPAALAALASLRLEAVAPVDDAAPPTAGAWRRIGLPDGERLALFAHPADLGPAVGVDALAERLVALRPDLVYHEPPHVVGLMLPGTRGARFGVSRDPAATGFALTALLNVSPLVAGGALCPRAAPGEGDGLRLERAAGGWWLTLSGALDEGGG
jgi:hypothetical protein